MNPQLKTIKHFSSGYTDIKPDDKIPNDSKPSDINTKDIIPNDGIPNAVNHQQSDMNHKPLNNSNEFPIHLNSNCCGGPLPFSVFVVPGGVPARQPGRAQPRSPPRNGEPLGIVTLPPNDLR